MAKHSRDIDGVIDGLLRQWGLTRASREQMVFAAWPEAVGDLARYAQPRAIANGCLTVAVPDSAWMQQLHFQRDEIKKKVNQALGGQVVREVKLTTRSFVDPDTRPAEPPPPPLDPAVEASAREAAAAIADPELREKVLATFLGLARLQARKR